MIKPILFNTDMVRAILEGRKTVTRRVVKPQPIWDGVMWRVGDLTCGWGKNVKQIRFDRKHTMRGFTPPYRPGDILYVRETWCKTDCFGLQNGYVYKANDNSILEQTGFAPKWRPSIHMPREAARIFLRVTDVRVEQLYAITGKQARAEGFVSRDAFIRAFLTMCPDCTMKSWVWVIEFERISREEAMNERA